MLIKKFLILVSFTCLLFVLHPTDTYADTTPGFKLTLTPIYKTYTISPGSSVDGSTDIFNQGTLPIFYSVYTTPYSVVGEDYTPYLNPVQGKPNVPEWFNLTTKGGVITKNQLASIGYTIKIPPGTPAGEYHAILFAESKPINFQKLSNQVVVGNRIGEIFYVVVPGKFVKEAKVVSWSAGRIQRNKISAELRIENRGSLHYQANINLNIKNIFNNKNYETNANKVVLPDTIRRVDINWPGNPGFGIYKLSGSVNIYEKTNLKNIYILVITKISLLVIAVIILIVLALILLYVFYGRIIDKRKSIKVRRAR